MWPLVGGGKKEIRVIPCRLFSAVAVVDIEIQYRHLLQPVSGAGMEGPDRYVVEQTEPHCPVGLGVMPRRTHGAEGVFHRADGHGINRRTDGSGGTQRGFVTVGAERGVSIKRAGSGILDFFQMQTRMHPQNLLFTGLGCFMASEWYSLQRCQHRLQPLRPLGMAGTGVVLQTNGVGKQGGGQGITGQYRPDDI